MTSSNHQTSEPSTYSTRFSDISFTTHYPEENNPSDIDDITNALAYLGAFDGLASPKDTHQ